MSLAVELLAGEISLPSLSLRWPDLAFQKQQIYAFTGSPNAPISDFFFFLAGLQEARHVTAPAERGKLIREEVIVPKATLLKLKYCEKPIYEFPQRERVRGIGFIFNDPELSMVGSTAREDIDHAFAAAEMSSPGLKACKQYGFTEDKLMRRVDVLSGGELHRLLCLIAVERKPDVLFVDLTRSNLDEDFLKELCEQLRHLASNGCCIFVAGIRLECLPADVSSFHVGDSGNISKNMRPQEPLIKEQLGELSKLFVPRKITSEIVLETIGVCRRGITSPISFDVHAREIVTIYGPNGCGKTTLGLIVAGRCKRGDYIGTLRMPSAEPVLALQHAARAFVEESLFAEKPDSDFWTTLGFDNAQMQCHPRALGYGMQKLAACALSLTRAQELCILDEPTCGMDYNLRKRFVDLLNRFPETAVLIFTHDNALKSIGRFLNYGEIDT